MQTRHRVPTIFTLYMVDVLCCALGCVILLWFLKIHETRNFVKDTASATAAARETGAKLDAALAQLATAEKELTDLRRDQKTALARAEAAEKDADTVRGDRDAARSRLAELDSSITALKAQRFAAEERLAKKIKDQSAVAKELNTFKDRTVALETLVREKEALARATARTADDLTEKLRDADARVRSARERLAALETRALALEKEAAERKKDALSAGATLQTLQAANRKLEDEIETRNKHLAAADRVIANLRNEQKSLADQANRIRTAAENRFAGIQLVGRRVVFLIDMSGSMELVDERTPAPEKWKGVRDAMTRIMGSLPDLEKFQVILFSDKVKYLLGNEGRWLDFGGKTSMDRAAQALAQVKPYGSTNMYDALSAAFSYRAQGLDTIYLLSDGLPNMGPGLDLATAGSLKETEREEILSNYIRKMLRTDWNRPLNTWPRVRINTVGFFYESPDVGAFLWALARENEGSFVGMSKP